MQNLAFGIIISAQVTRTGLEIRVRQQQNFLLCLSCIHSLLSTGFLRQGFIYSPGWLQTHYEAEDDLELLILLPLLGPVLTDITITLALLYKHHLIMRFRLFKISLFFQQIKDKLRIHSINNDAMESLQ